MTRSRSSRAALSASTLLMAGLTLSACSGKGAHNNGLRATAVAPVPSAVPTIRAADPVQLPIRAAPVTLTTKTGRGPTDGATSRSAWEYLPYKPNSRVLTIIYQESPICAPVTTAYIDERADSVFISLPELATDQSLNCAGGVRTTSTTITLTAPVGRRKLLEPQG